VKGFFVLIVMLAIIGAVIAGVGYYIFGDRFYDIIAVTEARVKATALQAGELARDASDVATNVGNSMNDLGNSGQSSGAAPGGAVDQVQNAPPVVAREAPVQTPTQTAETEVAQVAPPVAPPAQPEFRPEPVAFSDDQGRFSAVFPAKVSVFENYLVSAAPDKISQSRTYAASGREIVAQVTVLTWHPDYLPAARGLLADIAIDPADTIFGPTGRQLTTMLLGEGSAVKAVREFDAFERKSVELTGLIPNGEGGFHRSVVWLMPGVQDMVAVVLRAYDDAGLLGVEAAQFNQNFVLLTQPVPAAAPLVVDSNPAAIVPAPATE
jgi:hypothetical protein